PFRVSGGSNVSLAALGSDNVRLGINTTPRILLENLGAPFQIQQDNLGGAWRLARIKTDGSCPVPGCVPLVVDGNITADPGGQHVLPATSYDISLGSIQKKFGALWVADLFAETIVAIDAIGTIGNHWLVGSTNILDENITSSDTTIITRYNNFN